MKILIMTDMEGVAGILNHDDWVLREGEFYEEGRRLLTREVNSAVEGFCVAGADEIVVVDGHWTGGIDSGLLDKRASLVSQQQNTGDMWPWGMNGSFDGLAFVGQHAKAGTPNSHITHTQGFEYVDLRLNGISIGEYGQLALCAMELGVPTILACGEKALAEEAEQLTPGVVTVWGKRGTLPDGLDHLEADAYGKAKLDAVHLSCEKVRALIREGALRAGETLTNVPLSFRYPEVGPPYEVVAEFRKSGGVPAHEKRYRHPDSIVAVMNMLVRGQDA